MEDRLIQLSNVKYSENSMRQLVASELVRFRVDYMSGQFEQTNKRRLKIQRD